MNTKNGTKATPKDNSAKAQTQKLLTYLITYGFISTITARKILDIIWCPARINELEAQGYQFERSRTTQDGHKRIRVYHLVTKSFIQCDLFEGVSHD
jgi:hypothetical protein